MPAGAQLQFLIDYAGNGGWRYNYVNLGGANPPLKKNGVIVRRFSNQNTDVPSLRPSDIKGGMSNALLIGEKYIPTDKYDAIEAIYDDLSGYYAFRNSNIRYGDAGPFPDSPTPTASIFIPSTSTPIIPFGSAHPSAMNACFADGSVRAISYTNSVFRLLCDRTNTTPVNLDDLR